MAKFDSKTWNPNVFEKYRKKVPSTKENTLIKNGLFDAKPNMTARLRDEVGGNYFTEPIKGLIDGQVLNYDGVVDMEATSRDTFEQGKIIVGRMKAWQEKDFSTELTGEDFMPMAEEVNEYYEAVDQADVLAILKGIFAMADNGANFVENHTYEVEGELDAVAMNKAIQKASGDKKKHFKIAFMHSLPATNLENLNLLEYLKYTDANGITRDLNLATWNGKLVVIDDDMPVEESEDGALYTTYVLGEKFFEYDNVGVKHPNEMGRDAKTNGGIDILYTRQRKLFAPKWISFTKKVMASNSPTTEELANGQNWEVVNNGKSSAEKKYVNHKMIPLARIISRG